jgi:nitrate/TMAO reductase-like tetraheme cytochrome c subunit
MESRKTGILILAMVVLTTVVGAWLGWQIRQSNMAPVASAQQPGQAIAQGASPSASKDHLRASYDPIHFKPAIETARDEQCLACHREILDDKVRETSPAGVRASVSKAWYQQLSTYSGEQESFHRRHLVTPLAKELMSLNCNTCHQGHDPREEAPGSSATGVAQGDAGFTLRKAVNPETTCLKCHGQMPVQNMGLPSPWPESKEMFGNSCLTCHAAIRTTRHRVTYLKAEAIEAAGQKSADSCYGCHGGRSWYRIAYPYPRHAWDGMAPEVPDWAKGRPTASEARFQLPAANQKQ